MAERTLPIIDGDAKDGARPITGLLVGAGVVALITLGLVVRFGLVPPPALEPVDEATRPANALALTTFRDGAQCLDVIGRDGVVREVRCSSDSGPVVGWDERGILVLSFTNVGEILEVVDPVTGEVLSSERSDPAQPSPRPRIADILIDQARGTLTVRDEQRNVLWQVDPPDSYTIQATAVDPATGTIAMLDSARRILVLTPGSGAPRVWVEDAGARFGDIVWEGTTPT